MKANKIIYWITTILVSVMMMFSAYMYLNNDAIKQAFIHLGFPSYFRVELAVAKIIGAVVLLIPVQSKIKEWVYAGFAITFISAFVAHVSAGDPLQVYIMPLVFFVLLLISYLLYSRNAFHTVNKNVTTPAML
jgi:hypothetical protein